jgi:hypothetical protein
MGHDEGDRNGEDDDHSPERTNFRRHGHLERITAGVSCLGSIECSIERPAASRAHPQEQRDPVD